MKQILKSIYNSHKLLLISFIAFSGFLHAQQTVSGIISDENGPLPGVTVIEKGTTNGTVSDFDGNYSISVSNSNAILQL